MTDCKEIRVKIPYWVKEHVQSASDIEKVFLKDYAEEKGLLDKLNKKTVEENTTIEFTTTIKIPVESPKELKEKLKKGDKIFTACTKYKIPVMITETKPKGKVRITKNTKLILDFEKNKK